MFQKPKKENYKIKKFLSRYQAKRDSHMCLLILKNIQHLEQKKYYKNIYI